MQILITGATGFIGSALVRHLKNQYRLTVLSRDPGKAQRRLGYDITVLDSLETLDSLDAFDAVINLAGEPIADKRWSEKQKQKIQQSRWTLTQQLVDKAVAGKTPPGTFISGSAIGYYGSQGEKTITEAFEGFRDEFSHQVCAKWEALLQPLTQRSRVCIVRTGVVLGCSGGALKKMLTPFRFGLGGKMGSGEQYMSWIHLDDMVKLLRFLLENDQAEGTFNATAPNPVTNAAFTRTLSTVLKRPAEFNLPAWLLKLLFGEMSELMVNGQRVLPARLQDLGFHFCHPDLEEALRSLIRANK